MEDSTRACEEEKPPLVEINLQRCSVEMHIVSTEAIAEAAFIVKEIFVDNCYLKHGVQLMPGATVVDVGANIGLFGVRALTAVADGDVTYIGVEPVPANFKVLQYNLLGSTCSTGGTCGTGLTAGGDAAGRPAAGQSFFQLNAAYAAAVAPSAADRISTSYPGNILLFNKAVSDKPGTLPMTFYPCMPGNSTLRPQEKYALQHSLMPGFFAAAQQFEVPVITLQQLLQEAVPDGRCIDLLKVDVEGEELRVLQGLDAAGWRRVQQVVLEVHDCLPGEFEEPPADSPAAAQSHDPGLQTPPQAQSIPPQPAAVAAPACSAAAALAAVMQTAAAGTPPSLPGQRGAGIDGHWIKFVTDDTPSIDASRPPVLPPRNGGRVVAVAQLLQGLGFKVVVESGMTAKGVPINYNVYGRRAELCS